MNSGESDSCELPLIFPSDVCRGDRVAGNPREGDQTNCTKQNLWCCKVQIAPPKAMWRTFKSLPKYGMRRYIYFGTKTWNSMRRFFFFSWHFCKTLYASFSGNCTHLDKFWESLVIIIDYHSTRNLGEPLSGFLEVTAKGNSNILLSSLCFIKGILTTNVTCENEQRIGFCSIGRKCWLWILTSLLGSFVLFNGNYTMFPKLIVLPCEWGHKK